MGYYHCEWIFLHQHLRYYIRGMIYVLVGVLIGTAWYDLKPTFTTLHDRSSGQFSIIGSLWFPLFPLGTRQMQADDVDGDHRFLLFYASRLTSLFPRWAWGEKYFLAFYSFPHQYHTFAGNLICILMSVLTIDHSIIIEQVMSREVLDGMYPVSAHIAQSLVAGLLPNFLLALFSRYVYSRPFSLEMAHTSNVYKQIYD